MNEIKAGGICLCHTNKAGEIAELLGALAHEQRLMIVALLHDVEEMHVTAMTEKLDANRAALSRHLGRLRELGVVTTRRHHNRVYYALEHDKVGHIMGALGLFSAPTR